MGDKEAVRELPTVEQMQARFVREGIDKRLASLRETADRIEREAKFRLSAAVAGNSSYSQAVEGFVHELTWGVANLHLAGLLRDASMADIAHARGE